MKTLRLLALACALMFAGSPVFAQITVSLSITDSILAETLPGQSPNPGNVRITRTGSTTSALTVWVKVRGTAVNGSDYVFGSPVGNTLVIPAGSAQLDIPINAIDDADIEVIETVRVELDDATAGGGTLPYTRGNSRVIVNLLDNDSLPVPPLVSIETWEDGAEGYDGAPPTPGKFHIVRGGNTAAAVTVLYSLEGSATAGDDYAPLSGSVVIAAGETFADVVVTPVEDGDLEGQEWVTLTILPSPGQNVFPPPANAYAFGGAVSADVTIYDNEIPPTRAVVDVAPLRNGAEGAAIPAAFRFTRSANMDVAVTVAYSLGGSATAADYAAVSGSVTIPAGVASADVAVVPVDDALLESVESVVLTIAPSSCPGPFPPAECYLVGASGSASVTISDNEIVPTVSVTATQNPAVFGQPGAGIGSLTASAPGGHIVSYQVRVDGVLRATTGTGYTTPPAPGTPFTGNLPIPNVTIGAHTVQVTVTDHQGFTASASTPLVIAFIIPTYPKMSVTAVDAEAAEVAAGGAPNTATFRLSVDAPMPTNQYVIYRLSSPGPGVDFLHPAGYTDGNWPMFWPVGPTDYGYAFFPAGTTSVDVVVTPVDDAINEGTETLTLTLTYPFVFDERTFEGIVQFTEGGFYTPPYDPYALPVRYFDYDISATNNVATAVILDNDTAPTPFAFVSITTTDADAAETAPGDPPNPGVFTVSRVGPTDLPLSVNYQLVGQPRDIPLRFPIPVQAVNGTDFVSLPTYGTVTIPAGATSVPITISPIQDSIVETSEYVQINLYPSYFPVPNPLSYLLYGNSIASLVIRDLPPSAFTPVVRIKASDGIAIESGTTSRTGAFLVERIGSSTAALTVGYTIGGTATNGVDYAPLPSSVSIPAGALSATIVVDPIADGIIENIEIVVLTLEPPPSNVSPVPYVISTAITNSRSAGVSIRDVPPPGFGLSPRQIIVARRLGHLHPIVPVPVPSVPPPPGAPINWAVEASSDLTVWEEIGRTTDPSEFVDVTADEATAQRFYRFRRL